MKRSFTKIGLLFSQLSFILFLFIGYSNLTHAQQTWYSFDGGGNWSNPSSWTLDPLGGPLNPATEYPVGITDQVIIQAGDIVSLDNVINNQQTSSVTIEPGAVLDCKTFRLRPNKILGSGIIKTNSTFPTGVNGVVDANAFYENLNSQAILYRSSSVLLLSSNLGRSNFPNLTILKTGNSNDNFLLRLNSNLTVLGNLDLEVEQNGTASFEIGYFLNELAYSIEVEGDLNINQNARMFVENDFNQPNHTIAVNGSLNNNGELKLTNRDAPYYTEAINNTVVKLEFGGDQDAEFHVNGNTQLDQIIVNKQNGSKLTINSLDNNSFKLFGTNNQANANEKALYLQSGFLELSGSLTIPSLNEGNVGFTIPVNSGLILNGDNISVTHKIANGNVASPLNLRGSLEVIAGSYNGGNSQGILYGNNGSLTIHSGEVNISQFLPEVLGGSRINYTQTGGNFVIRGKEGYPNAFIENNDVLLPLVKFGDFSQISITGGTIEIKDRAHHNGINTLYVGFTNDLNVSGGLLKLSASTALFEEYKINVNPAFEFNDFEIENLPSSFSALTCNGIFPKFKGNVTVKERVTLNISDSDVYIGGNFTVEDGATVDITRGLTFYGEDRQDVVKNGTLRLRNTSDLEITDNTQVYISSNDGDVNFGRIKNLIVGSNSLLDYSGNIGIDKDIINNGEITGNIRLIGNIHQTLSGEGEYGAITLANTSLGEGNGAVLSITDNIELNGNFTFEQDGRVALDPNVGIKLGFNSNVAGYNGIRYFITDGATNTINNFIPVGNNQTVTYPIGTNNYYLPVTYSNLNVARGGSARVTLVTSPHPNTRDAANNDEIQVYWKVRSSGLQVNQATHNYTFAKGLSDWDEIGQYVAGRFDINSFTWVTNNDVNEVIEDDEAATIRLNSTNFNSDYTAAKPNEFIGLPPTTFYSRGNGNWEELVTWSTVGHGGAAAASLPGANDIVIISPDHIVTIPDPDGNPDLNSGIDVLALELGGGLVLQDKVTSFGFVSGLGNRSRLTIENIHEYFPEGDFENFMSIELATVEYKATSIGITMPSSPTVYPNLVLSGNESKAFPTDVEITVNRNLTTESEVGNSDKSVVVRGNLYVGGTLKVDAGYLKIFQFSANGNDVNITANNLIVDNNAVLKILETNGGTINGLDVDDNSYRSNIYVSGSIFNEGTIDLTQEKGTDLYFVGENNSSTIFSGIYHFDKIIVNKSDGSNIVTLRDAADIDGFSLARGLEVQNGTLNYQLPYDVTFSESSFTIPEGSKVIINNNDADIQICADSNPITANSSDLYLSGTLEIRDGNVIIGDQANDFGSDIIYNSLSNPQINIYGDNYLIVQGQVRRSNVELNGKLSLSMENNTGIGFAELTIEGNFASRSFGILEVFGEGSKLNCAGEVFVEIKKSNNNQNVADIRIDVDPDLDSDLSNLVLSFWAQNSSENFSLSCNDEFESLVVISGGIRLATLDLRSDIALTNNFSMINNSTLNIDGDYTLNIGGNFSNTNSTFSPNTGKVVFTGPNPSSINSSHENATTEFYNLEIAKEENAVVTVSDNVHSNKVTVKNNLNFVSGSLNISDAKTLHIEGNVTGIANVVSNGVNHSGYLEFSGENIQDIESGSFDNIRLKQTTTTSGDITINRNLTFSDPVQAGTENSLNIGNNLLTLGNGFQFNGVDPAQGKFVKTSGAVQMKGVRKMFFGNGNPLISLDKSFIWSIGVGNRYLPVTIELTRTNFSPNSYINIKPIFEPAPFTTDLANSNELGVYWEIQSANFDGNINVQHSFQYPDNVLQDGLEANYIPGVYFEDGIENNWYRPIAGDFIVDEGDPNTMTFDLDANNFVTPQGVPVGDGAVGGGDGRIDGIFTAALITEFGTPLRFISRVPGGNWTDFNTWGISTDGDVQPDRNANPGETPDENYSVLIDLNNPVIADVDILRAKTLQVESELTLGTTKNHQFNWVTGFGSIRMLPVEENGIHKYKFNEAINDLDNFEGEIIFDGGDGLEVELPPSITKYQGLTITGGGTKVLTSNISVRGSVGLSNGVLQTSEASKLTVEVGGNISPQNGFRIGDLGQGGNASTNGATSYVSGPLRIKKMSSGGGQTNIVFPIGKDELYRPARFDFDIDLDGDGNRDITEITLQAELFNEDPNRPGIDMPEGVNNISALRYWKITAVEPSSNKFVNIRATLAYNAEQDGVEVPEDIVFVKASDIGQPLQGPFEVIKARNLFINSNQLFDGFSIIVLGSTSENNPLPVTLVSFDGEATEDNILLNWVTASEVNNSHFEVQRSLNGVDFETIGRVEGNGTATITQRYSFEDNLALSGINYYRLKQVDYDGAFEYSEIITVLFNGETSNSFIVYPNPIQSSQLEIVSLDRNTIDQLYEISLHDVSGKIYYQNIASLKEASKEISSLTESLGSGVYMLKISNEKTQHVVQLLK